MNPLRGPSIGQEITTFTIQNSHYIYTGFGVSIDISDEVLLEKKKIFKDPRPIFIVLKLSPVEISFVFNFNKLGFSSNKNALYQVLLQFCPVVLED